MPTYLLKRWLLDQLCDFFFCANYHDPTIDFFLLDIFSSSREAIIMHE